METVTIRFVNTHHSRMQYLYLWLPLPVSQWEKGKAMTFSFSCTSLCQSTEQRAKNKVPALEKKDKPDAGDRKQIASRWTLETGKEKHHGSFWLCKGNVWLESWLSTWYRFNKAKNKNTEKVHTSGFQILQIPKVMEVTFA